jgi:hypothetical protein
LNFERAYLFAAFVASRFGLFSPPRHEEHEEELLIGPC